MVAAARAVLKRSRVRTTSTIVAVLLGLALGGLVLMPAGAQADGGYRLVRSLLYDDVRFVIWPVVGAVVVGGVISLVVRRSGRRG